MTKDEGRAAVRACELRALAASMRLAYAQQRVAADPLLLLSLADKRMRAIAQAGRTVQRLPALPDKRRAVLLARLSRATRGALIEVRN
ncbi:hypothetical protein [Inhella sp.]|uniref:hypothetical protein n=1 Tax=Inhella sp. TaxID=1921806 RepID=UPI0035B4B0AE